jgi:hypothetical protein
MRLTLSRLVLIIAVLLLVGIVTVIAMTRTGSATELCQPTEVRGCRDTGCYDAGGICTKVRISDPCKCVDRSTGEPIKTADEGGS